MLRTNTKEYGETEKLSLRVRWALVSLSLSMLMPSLDTSIANAGLPTLALSFGASFQEVQWVVLAYLLTITTLIVSVGRLGDMMGRRRLLLGGIGLFTLASLICGIAPTLWLLVAARACQGLGAAIMMAITVAMVGDTVPKSRTGSVMGLLGTMSAIGTSLGPSLGGLLIAGFGWNWIFLVNVPLGMLNFCLALRYLPTDSRKPKIAPARFDSLGTVVLGLTLAAYSTAMTIGRGEFGWLNLALLATAVVGLAFFILVESRSVSPLVPLAMFRDRDLSSSLGMSSLVSTVMMATLVVGPFYLSRGLLMETAHVGLALSVGPLVAALAGVPAGRIVDKFGTKLITVVGLTGIASGSIALSLLPIHFGVLGYVCPIVVMTGGYALFQTANNTSIMTGTETDQRGVISGMLSLSRNLGLITGVSVMGALFAFAASSPDITAADPNAIAMGVRITFSVAGMLILIAISIAVVSDRTASENRQQAAYRL